MYEQTTYCEACDRPLNTIRADDPDPRRRRYCHRCADQLDRMDKEGEDERGR
jgi:hypothetical protein